MKLLFDTSGLFNLIKNQGEKCAEILFKQYTLDLTHYELGNIMWKYNHRGILSKKEAEEILLHIASILRSMQIIPYDLEDQIKIFQFAINCGLSFYDSAYLYIASRDQCILVTDDEKMQKIARLEKIRFKKSSDF